MDKSNTRKESPGQGVPEKNPPADSRQDEKESGAVSETWAEDVITDLDDFIESQGIYIRQ